MGVGTYGSVLCRPRDDSACSGGGPEGRASRLVSRKAAWMVRDATLALISLSPA
ncbi:Uncharacterized protein ToN1_46300 [Aromatoleum petrolei]|nr:Uncharacterized protein ToN1_46300 [Aromatoleum petrolei]